MSVFFKDDKNEQDDKTLEKDANNDRKDGENNMILEYYDSHLSNISPNPLYKNTKFMTIDKINGGLLTEKERNDFKDDPTGYNFNLKDSGYLIVDVDIEGYFGTFTIDDIDKIKKLFNVDSFSEKIRITEYLANGKRKILESKSFSNIFFSTIFKTPYVLTPSKGYHFYFKNDITDEQLKELFGYSSGRYIKSVSGFSDAVAIDIFVDNKKNDAFIVLPLSNVIIENEKYKVDQENNYKLINVSYSGFRYTELEDKTQCNFANASVLLNWLKKYAIKRDVQPSVSNQQFSDRGKVVGVNMMNKQKYIKYMIKDFKILSENCGTISTYASKPFNLYQLMSFIAFFPSDMHQDLLSGFLDHLLYKLSDNAKDQLLTYYYHLATDENKIQDLKHPRYFEAIINKTYGTDIDNKYIFEHEKDEKNNENDDEEVIEDETISDRSKEIKYIIKAVGRKYSGVKTPTV